MNKTVLYFVAMFVIVLLTQAVAFNNLVLFNCAMAFVFIYMLISLPVTTSTNLALTVGFALGLCVDAFSDTYGLNTLSCTILAFVRKPVFHLYVNHDEDLSGQRLCMRTMGPAAFMKYALTMTLLYCIIVYSIEAFSFFNFWRTLLRIVASTFYTFIIIYAVDNLTMTRNEKKL